ncbi:MAG: type IV secretion system protein TraC [Gammaproteobacteria bacterium]
MLDITFTQKRLLERRAPAELFSILAYSFEDELYYFEDGSLGFAFMCYPLTGISAGRIQQLQVLMGQDYPAGSMLQCCLWTNPDIEPLLSEMMGIRERVPPERRDQGQRLAESIIGKRAEFLRASTRESDDPVNGIRVRDLQLIITLRVPSRGLVPTEREHERVRRLRQATAQLLSTIGVAPLALDPESYLRLMGTLLNWGSRASWRHPELAYDRERLIRDQLFDRETAVKVDGRGLWLGERRVKTLCVKRLPEYVHLANAACYLGDPRLGARGIRDNVLITLNVMFPESENARSFMETKKNAVTWQNLGPLARYLPRLRLQKESFDAMFDALDDGDRVVEAYLSWVLFADDEEASVHQVANAVTYYRELGFRLEEDRFVALPVFLNALPLCAERTAAKNLMRYRSMAGRHAVHLMPVIGDWKGTGSPTMTLMSRNGQIQRLCLMDSDLNHSAVVAAESGAGKSFFVNYLVGSYRSAGAQVVIIDVGRSYRQQVELLHGDYIEFTPERRISINPFTALVDYENQVDILIAVLITMMSQTGAIDDYQVSQLRFKVRELWDEKGQEASIDELAHRLRSHRNEDGQLDRRVNDMGVQLYPFTSGGEYGRWFTGQATIDFQNPLTVLELEELKAHKHLQKVVLVQLIGNIQRSFFLGDLATPKLLIIDEGWDLLTQGGIEGEFIERAVRQLRKYNGGAILITQSIRDLYKTAVGEAFAENSAFKFLLSQTPEAIDQLAREDRLNLGEGAAELLKSVHSAKGRYSEIFVYTRNGAGISRLVVSRFTQLMYTTDARERDAIKQRLARGMTVEEAINEIIAIEKQRGLASASAATH